MRLRPRIVDAVFGALELGAAFYDWVRNLRRPGPEHDGDTDPIPLTHRDAERIAEFGRRAGHEKK